MKHVDSVALDAQKEQIYTLKLYIAGDEQNSRLARDNLKHICNEYLNNRCQIDEVDVLTDFAAALKDRIFVTPTLVRLAPGPRATVVGNLENKGMVISALGLGTSYGT